MKKLLLSGLMLISLLALSSHAQNNQANSPAGNANAQLPESPAAANSNSPAETPNAAGGQSQGMNPLLKDVIDAFAKGLTLGSLIFAGLVALDQLKRNRYLRRKELVERRSALRQRMVELRWKKAELAKTVLQEMLDSPYAADAMSMLDWGARDYDVKTSRGGQPSVEKITTREVFAALRIAEKRFNSKEKYIRDCFDKFFGVMQTLEHYLQIDLIEVSDVRFPFAYYAEIMNEHRRVYEYYIQEYHKKAGQFLERFEEWTKFDPSADSEKAYFMFDCPPGDERFIFMLDEPLKIKEAREVVLSHKKHLHVAGQLTDRAVFYNEPWGFHLEPSTINFVRESYELTDMINRRVEQQHRKVKATFTENDIWHFGGARLLAEIPRSQFSEEVYQNNLAGRAKLENQERLRAAGNV